MKRSKGYTIGPAFSESTGQGTSGKVGCAKYETHSKLSEVASSLRGARFRRGLLRIILSVKKPFCRWRPESRVLWSMVPTGMILLAAWSVYVFAPARMGWSLGLGGVAVVYGAAAYVCLFGDSARSYSRRLRRCVNRCKRLASRRRQIYRKEAHRAVRAAAREVERGLNMMEKAKNGSSRAISKDKIRRVGEVAKVLKRPQPSLADLAGTSMVKSMLGAASASVFAKMSKSVGSHGLVESMTSGTKADKLMKLFIRRTSQGKANIAIDMIFHGKGRGSTMLDELLHTINEGGFSTGKFMSYGNASKLMGKKGGSMFGAAKSASSTFGHASSGSPYKAAKSAYRTGKKISKWL